MSIAVELQSVTKTFGQQTAVDELTLQVPDGSVYGFIGPNGSGKTTTLRMILRIYYPDRGRIVVLGNDHGDVADDRVGYLPEERGLYKKMKVREILLFFARLKGMRDGRAEVDDWLERMELAEWATKRVETLSKGMAQKIQFIATVVAEPQLVILDEPFTGLDPVNMEVIREAILEMRSRGTTVVFSTHDMDIAERMCDSVLMIFRGRKVLDGSLAEVRSQYAEDTLRVRVAGASRLADLEGIAKVADFGQYQELRMQPGCDPQAVLLQLMQRGRVEHFELSQPSLRDIFVRIAGPQANQELEQSDA